MEKVLDENKLQEFLDEQDMNKFKITCGLKFSDGKNMNRFWCMENSFIKKSNLKVCKEIMKQYESYVQMLSQINDDRYFSKLQEFADYNEEKSYLKFFSILPKAKMGSPLKTFWDINKNRIMKSDDELSKKVQKQYCLAYHMYKIQKEKEAKMIEPNTVITPELIDKINEFNAMGDLEKFSLGSHMKFKDGTYVYAWWRDNKKMILASNNTIFSTIKMDYITYGRSTNGINQRLYEDRLNDFYMADNEKFSSDSKILFKDGTSMYRWWSLHKDKISENKEETYLNIISQYESFMLSETEQKYEDKDNKKGGKYVNS